MTPMDSALLDVVNSSEAITKPTDGPEWVDGIRVSAHPLKTDCFVHLRHHGDELFIGEHS